MDLLLLIPIVLLLGLMFWNSNKRRKKMAAEQEEKARQTVPGTEVLLQGGIYGKILAYDPDNLDEPAIVEIAPGVDIKVHSQAILRIITPAEGLDEQAQALVGPADAFHEDVASAEAADAAASDVEQELSDEATTDAPETDGPSTDAPAKPEA